MSTLEIKMWIYTCTLPSHGWILKFVMAIIGHGISHKDTEHTDKCKKNKTKTTQIQYHETTDQYFFKIL
jgi:hypothetical protein